MVKIIYTRIKKTRFLERARERKNKVAYKSHFIFILLFHSEKGQCELQTL